MSERPTCDRIVPDETLGEGKCQLAEDALRLGIELAEMPPSRHAWSDIIRCPNDGCGREFLVTQKEKESSGT